MSRTGGVNGSSISRDRFGNRGQRLDRSNWLGAETWDGRGSLLLGVGDGLWLADRLELLARTRDIVLLSPTSSSLSCHSPVILSVTLQLIVDPSACLALSGTCSPGFVWFGWVSLFGRHVKGLDSR